MEIPRCCSISIQSDTAWRCVRLPRTAPARSIAPAYRSSFSVKVVLPASGWEMIANVRRRAISRVSRSVAPPTSSKDEAILRDRTRLQVEVARRRDQTIVQRPDYGSARLLLRQIMPIVSIGAGTHIGPYEVTS